VSSLALNRGIEPRTSRHYAVRSTGELDRSNPAKGKTPGLESATKPAPNLYPFRARFVKLSRNRKDVKRRWHPQTWFCQFSIRSCLNLLNVYLVF